MGKSRLQADGDPSNRKSRRTGPLHLLVAIALVLALEVTANVYAPVTEAGAAGIRTPQTVVGFGASTGFSSGNLWVDDDPRTLAKDLDLVVASGAHWIRVPFSRPNIQTAPETFRWAATDRVVAAAAARGLRILGLVAYTPAWDRPAGTSWQWGPINPAGFAKFARAAARRYAPQGIHTWEVWNEPNISEFWSPRPDAAAYGRLFKASAAAIRAADPHSRVITGGLVGVADGSDGNKVSPAKFIATLYKNGAANIADAIALHPYSYPYRPSDVAPGDWNGFTGVGDIRGLMQLHGDQNKALWATEYGAPTGTGRSAVSEATQASLLDEGIRLWNTLKATGPIFLHSSRDKGSDPASVEANFGVARSDFSRKKAFATITALSTGRA